MGLDLTVEGCAKPGQEAEWQALIERAFREDDLSDAEIARFGEICLPAFSQLGAPRVGFDAEADEWIIAVRKAVSPAEIATVLKDFHGHYALPLAISDGLPKYSHAGLYEGVDETSFRGAFLKPCHAVLPKELIDLAWEHKLPQAAVDYGRKLLAAADAARNGRPPLKPKRNLLSALLRREAEFSLEEQIDIVETAGRWFLFWGERGHPIRAWF